MSINYSSKALNELTHNELSKKSAIHQAGHAVAIYLGNRQKQLPPLYFQLYIKEQSSNFQLSRSLCLLNDQCITKLEENRLIHTLPFSIEKATKDISSEQKQAYACAFEADVINLLVGPLAEAKYVAMRDGELINPRLVNLDALHYYGGSSDLEMVYEYLACFIAKEDERKIKLSDLFLKAFSFINDRSNWLAITVLATYILADRKNSIDCEEVMSHLIPSLVRS